MPEPRIRFYLHSVAKLDGHRVIYLSVAVGETRPVRLATGYTALPADFSYQVPHLRPGATGYRARNKQLDALRRAVTTVCRRLEARGQLTNAALAPLLKAVLADLHGRPAPAPPAAPVPSSLPLDQQPLRAVWSAWQAASSTRLSKAYLSHAGQYVVWLERFDPAATPAAVTPAWARRYTAFLLHDTPLVNNTVRAHLNQLRQVVAYAGLPTGHIQTVPAHEVNKCALTWAELQQLHAWQPPAGQPGLARQKDVFVARCLCGLRYAETAALFVLPDTSGQQALHAAGQTPAEVMLRQLLARYQPWPAGQLLPVLSRQQTNNLIKQMLQGAGIDARHVQVRYKGEVRHEVTMLKWQAASLTTARHTYEALLTQGLVNPLTKPALPSGGQR